MPRSHTTTRTLAAALAIAALAAPTALAAPLQDLRSPDTKDAAAQAERGQDLRSPDTKDAATQSQRPDPKIAAALAQERYYATSVKPAPVHQPTVPAGTDDDTPWAMIGLGLFAAAALGAAGGVGTTRLRARRSRVTA